MQSSKDLKIITLQDIAKLRLLTPKRCRFLDNPIVKERQDGTYAVSTKFPSLDRMFEAETGIVTESGRYDYGPYVYLSDKGQIEKALTWQEARKSLIFLRDLLDCSLALDFNFEETTTNTKTYTKMGSAEHQAKGYAGAQAVQYLVNRCFRRSRIWVFTGNAIRYVPFPHHQEKYGTYRKRSPNKSPKNHRKRISRL